MTSTNGAARLWAAVAASLALFLMITVGISYAGTAPAPAVAAGGDTGDAGPTELSVEMKEFEFVPANLQAPIGSDITIKATNTGQAEHNIALVDGPGAPIVQAGGGTTLELGALEAGTYEFLCEVPGHADAGMRGTLTVADRGDQAEQTDAATGGSDHGGDHSDMTPEEMVEGHNAGIEAFPAETNGKGNQLLEPTMDGDVKVFELTADEIEWEVSAGEIKQGMAMNGQIPGPRIEANLGDTVRIVLNNDLDVPTAIHPHGLIVPNDMDGVPGLTQDPVMPGESFTYEFELENAGSHMYHSHFDSATQVPAGLLGAFIVHDKDDPKVDHDFTMIVNDGPLGYTINGKGFPATEPLVVKQGDKIRVRYMNEGLQIHPMHLHGMPQQVIAKDGWMLPQPHMEDTVLVAPGERVDVIIEATEKGVWAYHCHILNHAEAANGMFGMVTALIVE